MSDSGHFYSQAFGSLTSFFNKNSVAYQDTFDNIGKRWTSSWPPERQPRHSVRRESFGANYIYLLAPNIVCFWILFSQVLLNKELQLKNVYDRYVLVNQCTVWNQNKVKVASATKHLMIVIQLSCSSWGRVGLIGGQLPISMLNRLINGGRDKGVPSNSQMGSERELEEIQLLSARLFFLTSSKYSFIHCYIQFTHEHPIFIQLVWIQGQIKHINLLMGYTFLLGLIGPRTLRQEELQKTMRERVKWKQVKRTDLFNFGVGER